ncbi:MAG: 1-(5-phosphoribosyl)-5-[(5-phosphoribosylamino)methylideneamino] imidazole-4-carboxamide isomerase [Planctomycetota bacterium]|jgi:phosphoribosylformimino-5-aminoimidazole carboxamide ribotide isomerase
MLLIPVIDVRGGVVVHAVAGRRSEYRPLQSRLTDSTEPVRVLEDLQTRTGLNTFYVADLDGICDGRPDTGLLERLAETGCRLLIDAGAKTTDDLAEVRLGDNVLPVAASETFMDLDVLLAGGAGELIFSIDLHAGKLRLADRQAEAAGWTTEELAEKLAAAGIKDWIVLDTAAVGTGAGMSTLPLCRRLLERFADARIISGGGVKSPECVKEAQAAGIAGLLVATALHEGKI